MTTSGAVADGMELNMTAEAKAKLAGIRSLKSALDCTNNPDKRRHARWQQSIIENNCADRAVDPSSLCQSLFIHITTAMVH